MSPQTLSYRTSSPEPDRNSSRRGRAEAASCLRDFDEARRGGSSQRAAAEKAGVPRGTLKGAGDGYGMLRIFWAVLACSPWVFPLGTGEANQRRGTTGDGGADRVVKTAC